MHTLALLLLVACPQPADTSAPDSDPLTCDQRDADSDGVNACDDCDDSDPLVFPGAIERCNGVDDNCDDALAVGEDDADGDGAPDCATCDAAGYWELSRDTADSALPGVLASTMSGLRCGYSETASWMFTRLDNHAAQVECVYTGRLTSVSGTRPDPNTDMNVEHSWPQSQGADDLPMKCDLHHLFPADVDANQARANYPFGEVSRNVQWSEGGSRLGDDSSGDRVFEPRDAHKGDVARAMLYMSLEYSWSLSSSQKALFARWSAADPPDATERARTLAIAEHQAFANPFVACPELVDRLY